MSAAGQQKLEDVVHLVERLRGGGARRVPWAILKDMFRSILDDFPLIIQQVGPESKFGRGRILNGQGRPKTIDQLGPPRPDQCNVHGRCNVPKSPWAYMGVGRDLIFSEIGAEIGDQVGLLHMSPVSDLRLVRIGALDLCRRTEGMCDLPDNTKKFIKAIPDDVNNIWKHLLDSAISDFFSRPGSPLIYKITSAFAAALVDDEPEADGIMFDSVDHGRGACVAIKRSSYGNLKPTEAQIFQVINDLSYGIFDANETAFADRFQDGQQGKIYWQ